MEEQYIEIMPIREIHRLPRRGIVTKTKPKASELKSWLLLVFFSLALLRNILDAEALEHFTLFKSAFTLLKTDVSQTELDKCEKDLVKCL